MPTPPKRHRGSRDSGFSKRNGSARKRSDDKPDSERNAGGEERPFRKPSGKGKPFRKEGDRKYGDKPSFPKKHREEGERKPFRRDDDRGSGEERSSFRSRNNEERDSKPFHRSGERSDFRKSSGSYRDYKKAGSKFGDERKPFRKREEGDETRERKPFGNSREGNERPFRKDVGERKPFRKREEGEENKERRPFRKREEGDENTERKPFRSREEGSDRPFRKEGGERRSFREDSGKRPFKKSSGDWKERKPFEKRERGDKPFPKRDFSKRDGDSYSRSAGKPVKHYRDKPKSFSSPSEGSAEGLIRLNKYIANAGICSRREADKLIETGVITVNGKVITELGYKVSPSDEINFGGQILRKEKSVYILLNKPKDYITTLDDPEGRKTVLDLIKNATRERVYPVGRLDRNTTGLLLLTNDGEMTKKLTHPRYGVKKIYQATLNKALTRGDMQKIADGIELEDGPIKVDEISYVGDGKDKTEIGIQIHSGRNRIVRRMFESLGYDVVKLDRVYFAGLTKKDLPRGRWRLLTALEISMLKMIPGN